jgi:hypothetical protein
VNGSRTRQTITLHMIWRMICFMRCNMCNITVLAFAATGLRAQDDEDAEFLADAASLDDLEPFRDDGHPAPEVPGLFRKGESE